MSDLIYKIDGSLQNIYNNLNTNEHASDFLKNIKHELVDYCRKNNIIKKKSKKRKGKTQIINNEVNNSLIDISKVNQINEENKNKNKNDRDVLTIFYLIKKIMKNTLTSFRLPNSGNS
jgi:viroplasmin and RNaseH domain-containing protein